MIGRPAHQPAGTVPLAQPLGSPAKLVLKPALAEPAAPNEPPVATEPEVPREPAVHG